MARGALRAATAGALILLLSCAGPLLAKDASDPFSKETRALFGRAKSLKRPVLILITDLQRCPASKYMEAHVYAKPVWEAWSTRSVLTLRVELGQESEDAVKKAKLNLVKHYRVQRTPGAILVDYKGHELGRVPYRQDAYTEVNSWLRQAKLILAKSFDRDSGLARGSAQPNQPAEPKPDQPTPDRPRPEQPQPPQQPKPSTPEAPAPAGGVEWTRDLAAALRAHRPVLLVFWDSTQSASKALDERVFQSEEFQRWARDLGTVRIDLRQRQRPADLLEAIKLKGRYGVRQAPTVLLLGARGERLGALSTRPQSPAAWVALAQARLDEAR